MCCTHFRPQKSVIRLSAPGLLIHLLPRTNGVDSLFLYVMRQQARCIDGEAGRMNCEGSETSAVQMLRVITALQLSTSCFGQGVGPGLFQGCSQDKGYMFSAWGSPQALPEPQTKQTRDSLLLMLAPSSAYARQCSPS